MPPPPLPLALMAGVARAGEEAAAATAFACDARAGDAGACALIRDAAYQRSVSRNEEEGERVDSTSMQYSTPLRTPRSAHCRITRNRLKGMRDGKVRHTKRTAERGRQGDDRSGRGKGTVSGRLSHFLHRPRRAKKGQTHNTMKALTTANDKSGGRRRQASRGFPGSGSRAFVTRPRGGEPVGGALSGVKDGKKLFEKSVWIELLRKKDDERSAVKQR